jgi:hypothetical protein
MTKDTAVLNRQALVLFNFWLQKQQNDKRIGDLKIGDFVEMCEALMMEKIEKPIKENYLNKKPIKKETHKRPLKKINAISGKLIMFKHNLESK